MNAYRMHFSPDMKDAGRKFIKKRIKAYKR